MLPTKGINIENNQQNAIGNKGLALLAAVEINEYKKEIASETEVEILTRKMEC